MRSFVKDLLIMNRNLHNPFLDVGLDKAFSYMLQAGFV